MIDNRCKVCRNVDARRLIELGWNAKMSAPDLSRGIGGAIGPETILKHLKEHVEGGNAREVPVEQAVPLRSRVYAIQKLQVEEIERRVTVAQAAAALWNDDPLHADELRDWSYYFDILDKDMQAAVKSIIAYQTSKDKHETATAGLKIDLFRALASGGRPPVELIGGGDTIEGEAREVGD